MPSIFTHAIKRRRGRSRRPWWLAVVALVAAWVYNTYLKPEPPGNRAPRREPNNRRSPRRDMPPAPVPGLPAPDAPLEPGGRLRRDVVVKVYDGDTVTLRRLGSVRLIGADCPERAQPGGPEAGDYARRTLLRQEVEVEVCPKQPTDRYGRSLVFLYYREGNNRVLFNSELVRQGYARVYSLRPCTVDKELWDSYYEDARRAGRGLFATLGEVPDAASYRRIKRQRS